MANRPLIFIVLVCLGYVTYGQRPITVRIETNELQYAAQKQSLFGEQKLFYTDFENYIKARNFLEYKIENHSDEDYLLIVDPFSFFSFMSQKDIREEALWSFNKFVYNIVDESGNAPLISSNIYFAGGDNDEYIFKSAELEKLLNEIKKQKTTTMTQKNYLFLKAGESKTFSVEINLPITVEPSPKTDYYYEVLYLFDKEYEFSLYYFLSEEKAQGLLDENTKNYLIENNIRVFTGELISNTIKVIPN